MRVTETHLKAIAIGLIPVFVVVTAVLRETTAGIILAGAVMFTAFALCFIGMSMQKQGAGEPDDLLALPPKKP